MFPTRKMLVLSLVAFFCIVGTAMNAYPGTWQALSPGADRSAPFTCEVREGKGGLQATCALRGLESETVQKDGIAFTRVSVPGIGVCGAPGRPELPAWRRLVEVPLNAAQVRVSAVKEAGGAVVPLEGAGLPVYPVQFPLEKVPNPKPRPLVWDKEFYARAGNTKAQPVELTFFGTLRGRSLYLVTVYPIEYTPAANTLAARTSITFEIAWSCGAAPVWRDTRLCAPALEAVTDRALLNPGASTPKDFTGFPVGYLIIAAPAFAADVNLQAFAAWKTERGFNTALVSTTETGATTEGIRSYIQNAYATWEIPPAFVLLVGDTDTIPNWTGAGEGNPPTDLNYTTIDGTEYYTPDVWCGRFSVRTADQLATIVAKTLAYEFGEWTTAPGWEQQAAFMAGDDHYTMTEGTHNYLITNYFEPAGFTCDHIFEVSTGGTTQDIANALNAGRSWMVYSGHGGETSWADGPPFSQSNVNASTNDVYPYVLSFACVTGYYPMDECFMETWIRTAHGSILACGSSVNSYWDEDDLLEREVIRGFFAENLTWAAAPIVFGKAGVYDYYGNTATVRRYFEMYNLMGDPAIDIRTQITQELVVSHMPAVPAGMPTFTVNVDQDGAVAAMTQDGVLLGVGVSSGGSAVVTMDPAPVSGNVRLTVTARNYLPYQVDLMVAAGSDGIIVLDRAVYACPSTLDIVLSDGDLDGEATHDVAVGTTSGDVETVTLDAMEGPGLFGGTLDIACAAAKVQEDGVLQVAHGDTITATYEDADDGTGNPATKTDTALVDARAPGISNVQVTDITSESATVSFETDEPASVLLQAGEVCGGPYTVTAQDAGLSTAHSLVLDGLAPNTLYFFEIDAWDALQNQDSDTTCRSFRTVDRVEFAYPLDTDPGWTTEGQWAFGVPQGLEGDPASGHTGANVYGYNLNGAYPDGMSVYTLTTTAMDFTGYLNVSLSFWRWLQVESASYDHAGIDVSNDGSTWTSVWMHTGSDIYDTNWVECAYDISAVADNQPTVYIRWTMGPTDGSVTYCGWNIDDVVIRGDSMDSLSISPTAPFEAVGPEGGPFSPDSAAYVLSNNGADPIPWTAQTTTAWLDVTPPGGTLSSGNTVNVEVALNANADALSQGTHTGQITFTNTDTGMTFTRNATLTIADPLSVTPLDDLNSTGFEGGPFTPPSITYTLANAGLASVNWTADFTAGWLLVTPAGGALAPGSDVAVEVSLNAGALATGVYTDVITFTNVGSGATTTRDVSLEVIEITGEIDVVDSITPEDDLDMPFGQVFVGATRTEHITVHNTHDTRDLVITDILNFGYSEDFEDGLAQDWVPTFAEDWAVVSGEYVTQSAYDWWLQSTYMGETWQDCDLQIEHRRTGNVYNTAAVFFRASDDFLPEFSGDAYVVGFDGDGEYWVIRFTAGGYTWLQEWTYSPYLNLGAAANVVRVSVSGNTFEVYFNGLLAWSGADDFISGPGRIGLMGYSDSADPTTHIFDNIQVGQVGSLGASAKTMALEQAWYNAYPAEGGSPEKAPSWDVPAYAGERVPAVSQAAAKPAEPPFALDNLPAFPATVAPGGSLTFDVIFQPSDLTDYASSVTIKSNDFDEAQVEVALSGTGIPDYLAVAPAQGIDSTGPEGGPFTPANASYTLTNNGAAALEWSAAALEAWLDVAPSAGALGAGASTTVNVAFNAAANALAYGAYADTVTITNVTSGASEERTVSLTVTDPLEVSPPTGFNSWGEAGGPFTPPNTAYTLTNAGSAPVTWSAAVTAPWLSVSPGGGTLGAGNTVAVTVSLTAQADTLPDGTQTDTITFTNVSNGAVQTRAAVLDISGPPPNAFIWIPMSLDPGWTTEGAWEFGVPQGGGSYCGDPVAGVSGANVYGYDLAGDYTDSMPAYYLTTTAFDCSQYENVELVFWRWLGIESVTYDHASVEVSNNGTTWTTVWSHTSGSFCDGAWVEQSIDISAVADGEATVYLRWGMGPTDSSVTYPGWNIDDVALVGESADALVITPSSAFQSQGPEGGPFTPPSMAFTLTNRGDTALGWTASDTQPWLYVTPADGALGAGDSISANVMLSAQAESLTTGTYTDTVTFTNVSTGATKTRGVTLVVSGGGEGPTRFCLLLDEVSALMSPGGALDWLPGILGDDGAFLANLPCAVADLNGPMVGGLPGPNGMLDGAFELGVLAELLNNPADYAGLPAVGGVNPTEVGTGFQANYANLYTPGMQNFLTVLLPSLWPLLQNSDPFVPDYSPEIEAALQSGIPALLEVLAGFATLGDEDSLAMTIEIARLLSLCDLISPGTCLVTDIPTDPNAYTTFGLFLGPEGDADGDGFTNREEYEAFAGLGKDAADYVQAALDPSTHPVIEGEGEGQEPQPLVILTSPSSASVYVGMSHSFGVVASGGVAPLSFDWKKDGVSLGAPDLPVFNIASVAFADAGAYLCTVTDGVSSVNSGAALLMVFSPGAEGYHTADVTQDWRISLSELLRVIQFYNYAGLCCQAGTEDGYAPGSGDQACTPHDSDYNPQEWTVDLSELLRLIQFYNSAGRCYHIDAAGEDGFAPEAAK